MFRVLNNSNAENALFIQGSRQTDVDAVASVVFQNYDYNARQSVNLAAISAVNSIEGGDIVFKTTTDSNLGLQEQFRIFNNGNVSIGSSASNYKLSVGGALQAPAVFCSRFYIGSNFGGGDTSTATTGSNATTTFVVRDITTKYFTASNGVDTPTYITGFYLPKAFIGAFNSQISVRLETTLSNLYSYHEIKGVQNWNCNWDLNEFKIGDETGLSFSVNSNGQMCYTSCNFEDWVHTSMAFRANLLPRL